MAIAPEASDRHTKRPRSPRSHGGAVGGEPQAGRAALPGNHTQDPHIIADALRPHAEAIGVAVTHGLCAELMAIGHGDARAVAAFISEKIAREFSDDAGSIRRRDWPRSLRFWIKVVREDMTGAEGFARNRPSQPEGSEARPKPPWSEKRGKAAEKNCQICKGEEWISGENGDHSYAERCYCVEADLTNREARYQRQKHVWPGAPMQAPPPFRDLREPPTSRRGAFVRREPPKGLEPHDRDAIAAAPQLEAESERRRTARNANVSARGGDTSSSLAEIAPRVLQALGLPEPGE